MDKLKIKHNHKLTDILKVLIFSIVMMAPLFSIAVRCLYVICNKNAKDSYSDYEIQDTIRVTTSNNLLIENRDYIWTYITSYADSNTDYVYFNTISEWVTDITPNYTIVAFRLTGNSNLILRDNNNVDHTYYNYFTNSNNKTFNFNYKTTTQPLNLINSGKLLLVDYKKGTLDNVFDYSIQQVAEGPTFNWTTNTGIYTTINAMFTGLEMPSNNALAVMLTYWMICMLIYLVIDIIVALMTKMTHLFNE